MDNFIKMLAQAVETDVEISFQKKKGSAECIVQAKGNYPSVLAGLTELASRVITKMSDSKEEAIERAKVFSHLLLEEIEEGGGNK